MDAARWQPLVDLARPHATGAAATAELVSMLVGETWRGPGRAPSILNHDGAPLQLCLSASAGQTRMRMIGDPHTAIADPEARTARAVRSALALCAARGADQLTPTIEATIATTLPPAGERSVLRDGALWLAAAVDEQPGIALYTTLAWGPAAAGWPRVDRWFRQVLPDDVAARALLAPLAACTRPVSAAIEGRRPSDARAKVYVRLERGASLDLASLAGPEVARFVERALAGRVIPPTGMVISIGLAIATGEPTDVKVDVCGHCIPRSPAGWTELGNWVAGELGVQLVDLGPLLERGDLEVAFIGVGRRFAGGARCNVYLKGGR